MNNQITGIVDALNGTGYQRVEWLCLSLKNEKRAVYPLAVAHENVRRWGAEVIFAIASQIDERLMPNTHSFDQTLQLVLETRKPKAEVLAFALAPAQAA